MLIHSTRPKHAFQPTALRKFSIVPNETTDADVEIYSLDGLMHLVGAVASYTSRTEIVHEDEAGDRLYKVVSGTVCTYKILSDGRRQIGSFYLPGDVFGLEFLEGHNLAAETITNVKVLVMKKSALAALVKKSSAVASELFQLTARELTRAQNRVLLLSSKSAQERVVGFLFEMSKRSSGTGNKLELPMSRGYRRLSRADDRDRIAHFVGFG